MSALLDHLWQSTLFAAALGVLTLGFRKHGASVRYGLWFAASLKFLLPFSYLIALGGILFHPFAPAYTAPPVFTRIVAAAAPFSELHAAAIPVADPQWHVVPLLFCVWACGFAALSLLWLVRWTRLNALKRAARTVSAAPPVPVKVTTATIEPGLVGIWRPALLLPEGVLERLSQEELTAIEAHERCHLRRRDNLTAAIHMLVTNLFWFHPLLWWLGARLVEERERACDESVLSSGNDPATYARGILKVCAFYLPSPLACAAGVSGSNLTRRMETIMENRNALRLTSAGKALLAVCSTAVIAIPILMGMPSMAANGDEVSPQLVQRRLAEQRRPRSEIALAPALFDKYIGYYRMNANIIYVVSRRGDQFFTGPIGQTPERIYPSGPDEFFLKGLRLPAQFTFTTDALGRVTEMVLHQSGTEVHAPRVSEAEARAVETAQARRFANGAPSPGTEMRYVGRLPD